jgi:hypothetical protein
MKLTHTSPLHNWSSLRKFGILASYSKQGRVACWLHTARLDRWAEAHVKVRHDAENDDLIHIVVDVPRSWVRRHANGMYYCFKDIPASRFRSARIVRTVSKAVTL